MNNYHYHGRINEFVSTALISVFVVIALCSVVELELMFRTEKRVNEEQLNMANLSRFCTIEELEKRLIKEPGNYFVIIKLAQMYEDLQEYKKANEYYVRALKVSGNSNYCLYNYAIFCAKHKLYGLSATLGEKISGNTKTTSKYKAAIYEAIGDNLTKEKQYEAALKAYQISYKYFNTLNKREDFKRIENKYAKSHVNFADENVKKDNIAEAILNLENSLKIKEDSIARYKLAIAYRSTNKIRAERLINQVAKTDPFIVNPNIYIPLLKELIQNSKNINDETAVNYYSLRLSNFEKKLIRLYVHQNDYSITNSKISLKNPLAFKNKRYLLTFDIKNNTKENTQKLFIKANIIFNEKNYETESRITTEIKHLNSLKTLNNVKILLPKDFQIDKKSLSNKIVVKYFVKKHERAPWTLLKIEIINI